MNLANVLVSTALVGVLSAGLLYTITAPADASIPEEPVRSVPVVRTATVAAAAPFESHTWFARIQAAEHFMVSSVQGGRVLERPLRIGDTVQAGAVVAVLDPAPWRNALEAARASRRSLVSQLAQASRDQERTERLLAAELGTDAALEQIRTGIESMQAQLAAIDVQISEANRQLRESTVRATAAGVVTDVFIEAGEVAAAGMPLLAISTSDTLEVRFDVPESAVARLSEGQQVMVNFPMAGLDARPATITGMSRAGSAQHRLYPVRAVLTDEAGVLAGMSAEVVAQLDAPAGLQVPLAALVGPTGRDVSVWVVREDRAHPVRVEPIRIQDGQAVVHAPELADGAEVVVAGMRPLSAGVTIERAASAAAVEVER
jgi:RND family efflux transporter MFP subunit